MKKKYVLTMVIILALTLLATGCGGGGNPREDQEGMDAEAGSTTMEDPLYDEGDVTVLYSAYAGMKVDTPLTYIENEDKVFLNKVGGQAEDDLLEMMIYLYPNNYGELMTMSEEEFAARQELVVNAVNFYRASGTWTLERVQEYAKEYDAADPSKITELTKVGDETIYVYINTDRSDELPDDMATLFDSILKELAENAKKVEVTKPLEYEGAPEENSEDEEGLTNLNFQTTYAEDGKEVNTLDLYSGNTYTMVNVWTSWCGYCVSEMPELEKMNQEFKEQGCGIVGILYDGNDESALADGLEIMKDTGVTYPIVIATEEMQEIMGTQAYPTTFFVDSDGNIVGEPIAGARLFKYKTTMEDLLAG